MSYASKVTYLFYCIISMEHSGKVLRKSFDNFFFGGGTKPCEYRMGTGDDCDVISGTVGCFPL